MIPILVAIALIPRLLYAWYHPGIIFTPDSAIYYDFGRQLLSNFTVKFIFNPFKAPLYGIANFFSTPDILVILQMGIGILTTILVYRLSKNFLVATLASWNMLVIPWERAILSEAFSTVWVLIFSYLFIKKTNWGLFFVVCVTGLFLRTALMFLPIVALILLRKNKMAIISLLCYLAIIVGLIALNAVNWGYRGLQITSDINLFGKILQYNLPIESAKSHTYFYTIVSDYRTKNLELHPYKLLDYYDPDIYVNGQKLQELRAFTIQVLVNSLPRYIAGSLFDIPKALMEIDPYIESQPLGFLQKIYAILQTIAFFVMLGGRKSVTWLFALTQVLVAVFLSYGEYGRLISVVSPLIFVNGYLAIFKNRS